MLHKVEKLDLAAIENDRLRWAILAYAPLLWTKTIPKDFMDLANVIMKPSGMLARVYGEVGIAPPDIPMAIAVKQLQAAHGGMVKKLEKMTEHKWDIEQSESNGRRDAYRLRSPAPANEEQVTQWVRDLIKQVASPKAGSGTSVAKKYRDLREVYAEVLAENHLMRELLQCIAATVAKVPDTQ